MTRQRKPVLDRLLARVEATPFGCWEWTGATVKGRYGVIGLGGREDGLGVTHRVAYEELVGPIPEGLHLDHLCRNTRCVNPEHLEPVTQAENNRRTTGHGPWARRTVCAFNHPLDGWSANERRRYCRTCRRHSRLAREAGLSLSDYRRSIGAAA